MTYAIKVNLSDIATKVQGKVSSSGGVYYSRAYAIGVDRRLEITTSIYDSKHKRKLFIIFAFDSRKR